MEYTDSYIEKKVKKLKDLQSKLLENNNSKQDISEINELAEELIEITKNTYNKMAEKYSEVRTMKLLEFDEKVWNELLAYINKYLDRDYKKLKLLDIGAGHGRDLKFALDIGFDAIGADNSDKFIGCLEKLAINSVIPKK